MRKRLYLAFLFIVCFLLISCNNESGGSEMSENDIYDFALIKKAPKTKEKHLTDEVIKLYFNESDGVTRKRIAIDIKKEEVYEAPRVSLEGIYTIDETIHMEDTDKLIEIIDKYNVIEWENEYNANDSHYEDGYG